MPASTGAKCGFWFIFARNMKAGANKINCCKIKPRIDVGVGFGIKKEPIRLIIALNYETPKKC